MKIESPTVQIIRNLKLLIEELEQDKYCVHKFEDESHVEASAVTPDMYHLGRRLYIDLYKVGKDKEY